jgi:hypothetical protein
MYVPTQSNTAEPSAAPLAVHVPLAVMPLNLPVPLVAVHLLLPRLQHVIARHTGGRVAVGDLVTVGERYLAPA